MVRTVILVVALTTLLPIRANAQQRPDVGACNGHDMDPSIDACGALLDTNPTPNVAAEALFNRGTRLQAQGHLDRAISDFSRALSLTPNNLLPLTARGSAYIKSENLEAAKRDFARAIQIDPNSALGHLGLALYYLQSGRFDQSIASANEAIRIDPKSVAAYNNRGSAFREKGDYEAAIADFSIALRLAPYSARTLYNRALTLFRKGETQRAVIDFEASVRINPNDQDAVNGLKIAQNMVGQPSSPSAANTSAIPLPSQSIQPAQPQMAQSGLSVDDTVHVKAQDCNLVRALSKIPKTDQEWSYMATVSLSREFDYPLVQWTEKDFGYAYSHILGCFLKDRGSAYYNLGFRGEYPNDQQIETAVKTRITVFRQAQTYAEKVEEDKRKALAHADEERRKQEQQQRAELDTPECHNAERVQNNLKGKEVARPDYIEKTMTAFLAGETRTACSMLDNFVTEFNTFRSALAKCKMEAAIQISLMIGKARDLQHERCR